MYQVYDYIYVTFRYNLYTATGVALDVTCHISINFLTDHLLFVNFSADSNKST